MLKNIEAVIFDLDGTLVSVEERFYRVFLDTLKIYRLPTVEKKVFMQKFKTNRLDDLIELEDKHAFWIVFLSSYCGAHREFSKVFPGVRGTLATLKRAGIKIGLITGRLCEPDEVLEELREQGLRNLFDVVVTKKLVMEFLRPEELFSRNREIIQALDKLRANPMRSVLVADYSEDVKSAKELGLKTVAVLSGSSDLGELRKVSPDLILKSVAELPVALGLADPKS
ncbi:MAG: HAD family hydrolase [Hadesarchaea archaeon]|nr:HAD family hydrolase [Hadesarchaea archaeon]